jgi:trehalose 6-phosphate synthase/phosphatase
VTHDLVQEPVFQNTSSLSQILCPGSSLLVNLHPVAGEEVLPTQMQPLQFQDFEDYLAKYVGQDSILALLLDYDGTLSPIAPHPDLAVIPPETKKVLARLARMPDVFVAIISGRGVNNVKQMVGIEGITYAGNHGLEIIHPDGSKVQLKG